METKLLKPAKLEKGDTIVFIAPAGGLAALTLHRLEKGKQFFEDLGYKVKIFLLLKRIQELALILLKTELRILWKLLEIKKLKR